MQDYDYQFKAIDNVQRIVDAAKEKGVDVSKEAWWLGAGMKKSLANQICKLWNDNFTGSYAPTKTKAKVCKSNIKGDYSVEVHPYGDENDGHSFHSHNEVSDIERAFKVSSYISQDENNKLCARIF